MPVQKYYAAVFYCSRRLNSARLSLSEVLIGVGLRACIHKDECARVVLVQAPAAAGPYAAGLGADPERGSALAAGGSMSQASDHRRGARADDI